MIGDTIVLTTQIDSQHVNTYTYWFVSEWERKSCQIKFVKTDVKLSGQFSRQSDSGSHTRRCRGKRGLLSDKRMSRISWSQSYISWSWFPLWQQSLVNLFHMQSNIRQCTVAKKTGLKTNFNLGWWSLQQCLYCGKKLLVYFKHIEKIIIVINLVHNETHLGCFCPIQTKKFKSIKAVTDGG